jgi:hypothetical protein
MVKFYWYKHPKTGKMHSDQRMIGYEKNPLVVKGVKCELDRDYKPPEREFKPLGPIRIYKDGQREAWQADPDYVKKMNPKFVEYQDGHKERYDPTKHC